ncbi:MAG: MaoC/PaaZ C-terminal domain-containing protein [Pseudomonadota bacterium]
MALKAADINVGDTHEEVLVEDLKRTQLVMYAGASGDYNPLHTDEPYTRDAAGYPGVFAHGMLTMGMTGRVVTNFVGAANVRKFGVRFTNQVWPGDTLTGKATVESINTDGNEPTVELSVETVNQDGAVVIKGSATALIEV